MKKWYVKAKDLIILWRIKRMLKNAKGLEVTMLNNVLKIN
jgi:hypothetical protein